jgi:hypothetical protein
MSPVNDDPVGQRLINLQTMLYNITVERLSASGRLRVKSQINEISGVFKEA